MVVLMVNCVDANIVAGSKCSAAAGSSDEKNYSDRWAGRRDVLGSWWLVTV